MLNLDIKKWIICPGFIQAFFCEKHNFTETALFFLNLIHKYVKCYLDELLSVQEVLSIFFILNTEFSYIGRTSGNFDIRSIPHTVCLRSSDQFYIVSYYIKWVTTSVYTVLSYYCLAKKSCPIFLY